MSDKINDKRELQGGALDKKRGFRSDTTYSILGLLLFSGNKGSRSARALKSVLTIMAMGAFDEYVQSFFPYRSANVMDWTIDVSAGIGSATLLWTLWPRIIEAQ